MKGSWNQTLNIFLRIYFVFSIILLCILLSNQFSKIKHSSNFVSIELMNQIIEYQKGLYSLNDAKLVCNSTSLKVGLESIKHFQRSYSTLKEIFNYLTITLNKSQSIDDKLKDRILSEVSDRKNVIELELEKLSQTIGLQEFKNQRLKYISELILSKVTKLQNPPEHLCDKVPKIICKISIKAGFASGIHELLWCLVLGYHHNKTVIFNLEWDLYFESRDEWDIIFKSLSNTCDYKDLAEDYEDQLNYEDLPNTVIQRKLINQLPKEFGAELMSLVDSPNSWFHSQFIGYILRPQPSLENFINDFKIKNDFKHPVVGIQVRRSDKVALREALYYPVSDYMTHVKDFFDKIELNSNKTERRVYVASDDPSVFGELKNDYPDYNFIGSVSNAKIASSESTRYSNSSLWGVLMDVFLLSESDYIVCTFSSAICRLSYELMRFKKRDASFQYRSLDVPFHYHHSLTPVRTAIYNHRALSSDQWSLLIGDHLHERIRGNHTEWFDQAINGRGWDSYFFASNSTKHRFYKLYPNYKVYDDIDLV